MWYVGVCFDIVICILLSMTSWILMTGKHGILRKNECNDSIAPFIGLVSLICFAAHVIDVSLKINNHHKMSGDTTLNVILIITFFAGFILSIAVKSSMKWWDND